MICGTLPVRKASTSKAGPAGRCGPGPVPSDCPGALDIGSSWSAREKSGRVYCERNWVGTCAATVQIYG